MKLIDSKYDNFFEITELCFISKSKDAITGKEKKPAVICNSLNNLMEDIESVRMFDQGSNLIHKIGLDGGGGFFKITLSIFDPRNSETKARMTYSEGIANKFKHSGVKKLFIIALVSNIQENYENVLRLWTSLNMRLLIESNPSNFCIATDLKLIEYFARNNGPW